MRLLKCLFSVALYRRGGIFGHVPGPVSSLGINWISLCFFSFFLPFASHAAIDSTEVLPPKVNSPALRIGLVSSVGQKYDSQGHLMSLTDLHSIEFNSKALTKIEPQVNELTRALNQFGRQNLGDSLYLGTLKINTQPEIRYMAPLHAYGVTSKWTVAVGLPIVQYTNHLSLEQTGSNLSAIERQVGHSSQELNNAFHRLNVSLVESAQQQLSEKGYKALVDRSDTIVGDLQIASLYQFYKTPLWAGLFKTILQLPTGPKPDPDDLADLGIFGETAVEPSVLVSAFVLPRLMLGLKLGMHLPIPDRLVVRVPTDTDDTLPGADTKREVTRQLGASAALGVSGNYNWSSRLSTGLGYELMTRARDRYTDVGAGDVGLLEDQTNSVAHRVRAAISYSSIEDYMRKEASLPSVISYEISDTFRGINVERQTIQELWLTMFF